MGEHHGIGHGTEVTPSARRLLGSMRDIGYDFHTAVADLVDNSVSAGARRVDIDTVFDGAASYVMVADDGAGMSPRTLVEALRLGTRRGYGERDLGRFGLGLKTASLSQCRRLTVLTRQAPRLRRITGFTLDLDEVIRTDRWRIVEPRRNAAVAVAEQKLAQGPGTVVIWEDLDRLLPEHRPEGGWARRRLDQAALRTAEYLSMVFHRFLEGVVPDTDLVISVNGDKLAPWNPFAPGEPETQRLPPQGFELVVGDLHGVVSLVPYVLPSRDRFSSHAAWERMSGPQKWNRQQGLYIYRADRLIQGGGWCGLRAVDEHVKLARAAVHFTPALDPLFHVNVAKMRVTIPPQLRAMLERPVNELCKRAESAYRRERTKRGTTPPNGRTGAQGMRADSVALALSAAAIEVGEVDALRRIVDHLRSVEPEIAQVIGF